MAADWIPCELGLFKKAEVLAIASKTKRSRHDVGGLMLDFWGWCSNESTDGHVPNVGVDMLPGIIGGDRRFWEAVVAVGWLIIDGDGFQVPNAERWISRGAKARLGAARRKQKQRDGEGQMSRSERDGGHDGSGQRSRNGGTKSGTTEQNRTERDTKRPSRQHRDQSSPAADAAPPDVYADDPDPDGHLTLSFKQQELVNELRGMTGETDRPGYYRAIVYRLGDHAFVVRSKLAQRLADRANPVLNKGAILSEIAKEVAAGLGIQLFRPKVAA